ncbi:MAG: FHA domain-containing protein [Lachnospiraceae bacterium]|nr:FHA domain-containing protein [Lachnospiraceae bacterium]
METNQIILTPNITIPKGNFDFVMEATHNEQLYLGCLNAEKCMMTDYDSCLKGIRRSIEMLGIELEKTSRAEEYNISPDEALRSIFIDLKRGKNNKGGHKERRRISKKNFYIRHVVDFEKKDHEEYTKKQISDFVGDYISAYPEALNEDNRPNRTFRDIAYDLYARCSRPLSDKGSGTKEDSANLIRLFHGLLCLINYVREPYDPELTPMDDLFPVPYEYYDELNLINGINCKIYVSGDGSTYYMLKRKDIEYMDILNPEIYKIRMQELNTLDMLWGRLAAVPGYNGCRTGEVGTHDYRRAVYEFASRPQALTGRFIERLDKKSRREELSRGLIRLIRIMHDPAVNIPHGRLNPECIYICETNRGLMPYIVSFDNLRASAAGGVFPDRSMLDDYFNSIDMQKFIAPEIRNSPPDTPYDQKSADIYSLGKLIKYIYGHDENKVRDYVDRLIIKDPSSRPKITEAARMYDDEVVYFEPTVVLGNIVLTEFRLLIFSAYHGFEEHIIKDTVTIGRMFSSSGRDIKVDSPIASRTHGRFVKTDSGFEYVDMLSTNGTFINGILYGAQRSGRPEPRKLKLGDILKIDHPEFVKAHRDAVLMFVLGPSDHEMKGYALDITEGMDVAVGRENGDITLANNRVSKKHARFVVKDGVLYIQDLNSTNGVFVNGSRIESTAVLYQMDCVRIVDYVFIVSGNRIYYYAE